MKSSFILLFILFPCICTNRMDKVEDFSITHSPDETKSRFAMLDDVRILANGLLQLGHGLKDFVHKTKGQINDIFQRLSIFDKSFYELSLQTNQIKVEEEELKKTTTILKIKNEEVRNMSLEINSKINEIIDDRTSLESKVGGLEQKLNGLTHNLPLPNELKEISTLKAIIEGQEKNIRDLVKVVHEQHTQLDQQKTQIKDLEEKLSYPTLQDNIDNSVSVVNTEPDVIPYLMMNTTNNMTSDKNDPPTDCNAIYLSGQTTSGIYAIKPNQSEPFHVYCEMTEEGGWTVIQHRMDGSVDFDQNWDKYEQGFGKLESEFWLGLEKTHAISRQGEYILHIDIEDWKNEKYFVEYIFRLSGKESDYTIHLHQVAGDLPISTNDQTGMKFSTKDRDNDKKDDFNCAQNYSGGWWFNACGDSNLNGKFIRVRPKGRLERRRVVNWKLSKGNSLYLKSTKIKIRPSDTGILDRPS
uniref:Angiopoietin-like 3 n=1 Tax=Erpetoichthys calabaricus TaxID=27687 RepID=A0A8C4S8M8_ERPCA